LLEKNRQNFKKTHKIGGKITAQIHRKIVGLLIKQLHMLQNVLIKSASDYYGRPMK